LSAPNVSENVCAPIRASSSASEPAARRIVTNLWSREQLKSEQFLVPPQSWGTLDYRCITSPDISATLLWTARQEAVAHGLAVWFDATLAEDICLSNAPGLPELVYGHAFFPWTEPVSLSPGDEITVTLQAALAGDDYIWRWDTQVVSQADTGHGVGFVKASLSQSSLTGSVLSPAQLVKNAAHYVAVLSPEGEIDRHILNLMDGKQPLGQIAGALMQEFPGHFSSWNDALGRVGKLSQAYGS
jgi:protein arginine N-methyltransferase 1